MKRSINEDLLRFVRERCEVMAFVKVLKTDLWAAYRGWAIRQGLQPVLWSVFCYELQSYLPIRLTTEHFSGVRITPAVVGGFVADPSFREWQPPAWPLAKPQLP